MHIKPSVLRGRPGFVLRPLSLLDSIALFELIERSREHLSQWGDTTSAKYPDLESVSRSIIDPPNPAKWRFGIWNGKKFLGSINLTPTRPGEAEIGYWIGERHTSNGYATEAVVILARWAFQTMGLKRLTAQVHIDNLGSQKALGRARFNIEYECECGRYLHCEMPRPKSMGR